MCYGGLAGAGETENGSDIGLARQVITLLSAVAAAEAVSVGAAPGKGQGALLKLAKVSHTENGGAVVQGVKEGKTEREVGVLPLGVGKYIYIRLVHGLGLGIKGIISLGAILEVQKPVKQQYFLVLGNA